MTNDKNREVMRTRPDYRIYVPAEESEGKLDGGHECLSVVQTRAGELLAFWIQTSREGAPNGRYVMSRSGDGGRTWSPVQVLFGGDYDPLTGRNKIHYARTFQNANGKLYMILNKSLGVLDPLENGIWYMTCSRDHGQTWTEPVMLPGNPPKFKDYDNDDPEIPPGWLTYDSPVRMSNGKYIGGITHWLSATKEKPYDNWCQKESVCEVYLIENLDDDPVPGEVKIRWTAVGEKAFRAPSRGKPENTVAQEPTFIELPDHRIVCIFRTNAGCPYYTISGDFGETWGEVAPLRYGDGLPPLMHPRSPCPCFSLENGEYVIFIHNHDGNFGPWNMGNTCEHRRPLYMCRAIFDSDSKQPLRFSVPMLVMDNDGIPAGHSSKLVDIALYGSLLKINGKWVLWYPDRKHFLLGKVLDMETFNKLCFPK